MQQMRVERLGHSSKGEALDVFTQAFAERPLIPAIGSRTKDVQRVLSAFLDFFGGTKQAQWHGIREGNRLVCAALSVDASEEPSPFALFRFIFALSQAIGCRAARELEVVHKEAPKHAGRYLELVLLGTSPEHQGRGFGRKVLRSLIETAKKQGFDGVILVADRDTPAFRFYLKEGFQVDKEFTVGETALCWMRYEGKQ
ncbi:MAG: GNAT family N-acetyltransferase [Anaerolineae bacterium]|nr:GNAT family N-acetyltransferase [Candidatus Roseilinea sp.]MDW8448390.1 GNAT family N-acetyltransferase [Anaerolineae bacterium]